MPKEEMPAKVILEAVTGSLDGTRYAFEDRNSSILGRAKECSPRVPNDKSHKAISRHHCLIDVNPPDIRVRDFGSLNGTYVNGKRIGQRAKDETPEKGAETVFLEYDLSSGDELRVGTTVFRIEIHNPRVCDRCSEEVPDGEVGDRIEKDLLCNKCVNETKGLWKELKPSSKQSCSQCGEDVSNEVAGDHKGNYICIKCKDNPQDLVQRLSTVRSNENDQLDVDGYEIGRELGRGGMGVVYLARNEATGKNVALKVMLPKVAASPSASRQFMREIQNTQVLKHRNIVKLMEFGNFNGAFYCTLEYCDGGDVWNLMEKRDEPYSVPEASEIILQVLDGLEYAHNANIPNVRMRDGTYETGEGLVHRDLKLNNIFLSAKGSARIAKIGDFGLSKAFDLAGLSGQTRTGSQAGTPVFMPRQQVINFKYSKPEVDVWAAVATFYFMLTRQTVRDLNRRKDPWQQVLQIPPTAIRKRNSAIPKPLAAVIDKALVDKPEIHFKSAQELRDALEAVL